jgi:GNAT superfamily N-acetyltransferase
MKGFRMTGEDITIRPAKASDADQLWPLVEDFAVSSRPGRSAFERSFHDLLDRNDTLVLVAASDDHAVVGYLLGSVHGTFFANGPVAWIEELMVSEPVRRLGAASKLMASAEEWARSIPTAYIALASRRAGDFYLKIGYEESATYFRKTFAPVSEIW